MVRTRKHQHFAVGQTVQVEMPPYVALGTLVEDRGNIGAGGRHLWRVRVDVGNNLEPLEFEVPETVLQAVAA